MIAFVSQGCFRLGRINHIGTPRVTLGKMKAHQKSEVTGRILNLRPERHAAGSEEALDCPDCRDEFTVIFMAAASLLRDTV